MKSILGVGIVLASISGTFAFPVPFSYETQTPFGRGGRGKPYGSPTTYVYRPGTTWQRFGGEPRPYHYVQKRSLDGAHEPDYDIHANDPRYAHTWMSGGVRWKHVISQGGERSVTPCLDLEKPWLGERGYAVPTGQGEKHPPEYARILEGASNEMLWPLCLDYDTYMADY